MKGVFILMELLISLFLFFSVLFFLLGYAYSNNKAEKLLSWNISGKETKVNDKKGHRKQLGKFMNQMGVLCILFSVFLFLIEKFDVSSKLLYVWLVLLVAVVFLNFIQTRKFFK